MKLTPAELDYVRSKGLYITEKCDGCGKALNQSFRHTITGKPEMYCSAACRDFVFFGDRREAMKRLTPKKCAYCGGELGEKNRGALYCDDKCRMRANRAQNAAHSRSANSNSAESTGCQRPEGPLGQSLVPPNSGLKSGQDRPLPGSGTLPSH